MKIYNKSAFIAGILCSLSLPMFAFGIIHADWFQWLMSIAVSAKLLYTGRSQKGSDRDKIIKEKYEETAVALYGRHHKLKTNLPFIITGGLVIAAGLQLVFNISMPIWVVVMFPVSLTIAATYSIGIERSIAEAILSHTEEENSNAI